MQYKFFSLTKSDQNLLMKSHDNSMLTKKQLIIWLNELLKLQVSSIDELFNGAAFCQLLDIISHGDVRMHKVNWNAKYQHENLSNLKILSTSMHAMDIAKKYDAARISQKKTQDILELLQWFRKYFAENHVKYEGYDPEARRRINAQKLATQTRLSVDNISRSRNNSIKRTTFFIKQKREPEDLIPEEELKNCYKINRAIKRIIQDKQQKTENKLHLIKTLVCPQTEQRGCNTQNQESALLSCAISNKEHVEQDQNLVKIEGNLQQMQTMTGNAEIIKTASSTKKSGQDCREV